MGLVVSSINTFAMVVLRVGSSLCASSFSRRWFSSRSSLTAEAAVISLDKAPHGNAGVVVVLDDQLFHLGQGVGTAVGHVHGDVGDLCPDDKTLFITQVVEILCVLIVCQPDGVGAHFQNDGNILLHHFVGQGIARTLTVLVAGNTTQRVTASIQMKSLLGVDLKLAAAEPGRGLLAIVQLGRYGVEERDRPRHPTDGRCSV